MRNDLNKKANVYKRLRNTNEGKTISRRKENVLRIITWNIKKLPIKIEDQFLVIGNMLNNMLNFKPVQKMAYVRIETKTFNVSNAKIYAQTKKPTEGNKEKDLRKNYN